MEAAVRIGDILFFSPKYRFQDLDFEKPEVIVAAFLDRVERFYFAPAERLVQAGDAFAAGLVICGAIEFIAKANGGREEPEEWLETNVEGFSDQSLAKDFWEKFRHGLTHEGRVKAFGEFSFEIPDIAARFDAALVINPRLLLTAVEEAFRKDCSKITAKRAKYIASTLKRLFEPEVKATHS
jgi:hypothetical protein